MAFISGISCVRICNERNVFLFCASLSRNIFTDSPKFTREIRKLDESKTRIFLSKHVKNFKNKYLNRSKESIRECSKIPSYVGKNGEKSNGNGKKTPIVDKTDPPVKEGIFKRFKNTYKQHGKICIAVHLFTSSIWTAIFYSAVLSGVDIPAFLSWMGVGEGIIKKLNSPSVGHIASTYILYKLATPLRYTVTIAGTRYVVKHLQSIGRMPITPEKNKLSSLLKEGGENINKRRLHFKRHR